MEPALCQCEVQVECRRVVLRVVEKQRRQRDVSVTGERHVTVRRRRRSRGGGAPWQVVVCRQVVLHLESLERDPH